MRIKPPKINSLPNSKFLDNAFIESWGEYMDKPIPYEIVKPKVYAVDLDGTICLDHCWNAKEVAEARPNTELIEKINDLYGGNFIVIHTARRHELYLPTIKWLSRHNVRYHSVRFEKLPCDVIVDLDAVNRVEDL